MALHPRVAAKLEAIKRKPLAELAVSRPPINVPGVGLVTDYTAAQFRLWVRIMVETLEAVIEADGDGNVVRADPRYANLNATQKQLADALIEFGERNRGG
jgi:hypothetical protein